MKSYQDILRDQTSRNFAVKNVNTSLLLLPLRLETKIMNKELDATDEPERALTAFEALHSILQSYYDLIQLEDGAEKEAAEEVLKQQIRDVVCIFQKIDLLFAEDKALLKDLANNVYETFDKVELQDVFAPLIESLDDVTHLTSINDKYSTNFLNEYERIVRLLENTVRRPKFIGKRRMGRASEYSKTVSFRLALRNYKEVRKWLGFKGGVRRIDTMARAIEDGVITTSQCTRFKRLTERIVRVMAAAPGDYPYEVLTHSYRFGEGMEFSLKERTFQETIYPAKRRNKWIAYYNLREFAQALYPNIKSFVNDGWKKTLGILQGKVTMAGDKPLSPTRYSVLASKMLNAEMAIIRLRKYDETRRRRAFARDYYHNLSCMTDLMLSSYYTYKEQYVFIEGMAKRVNEMAQESSLSRTIQIDCLSKGRVLRKGSIQKTNTEKCLCIRIYPDIVALTQTVRQISRVDYLTGKDFWLKYIFNTDRKYRESLWLGMCDLYPAHRAAFILKRTFPKGNYKIISRKAKEFHDEKLGLEDFKKEIDENFVNSFPTTYVDNCEQLFTVPVTSLLPDRFVVNASVKTKKTGKRTLVRYGHRLPKQLQVGLDLNNLENATSQKAVGENSQLFLNGGLSWMTDYDEAERMGMAITVPLSSMSKGLGGKERSFEFSQIFVYGITDADDDEASRMIEEMLTAHLYSDKAMDVLSFDAATNILTSEDAKDAYDSSEGVQRERFRHQPYNCVNPHKPEKGNDLDVLDQLLCLKESVLGNIDVPEDPGTSEVELQRCVNELMLEYLTDPKISNVINPLLAAIKDSPTLHDYMCKDVLPRGPFPMLRIGSQPYGILPVCDFRNIAIRTTSPLAIVKKILVLLTTHWNNILSRNITNCYGKDADSRDNTVTTEDYLDILGNTPRSTSFYRRKTVKGKLLDAEYFRGERFQHQISELYDMAVGLNLILPDDGTDKVKSIIPDYDAIPVRMQDDPNSADVSFAALEGALDLQNIVGRITEEIERRNKANKHGIQLGTSQTPLNTQVTNLVIEFFDLFNFRLDAWLMGILNNKLRTRIEKGRHRVSLGCFGWLFNLKENDGLKLGCTDEYILAPSVSQAITGAIMRSSYNNSIKNGKEHNYDMGVNLSSERVRTAIRIIEGIQNGLSLGAILGADMERLIHEDYKAVDGMELDSCIYPLRQKYPLMTSDEDDGSAGSSPVNITVLNGAKLLEEYAACKEAGKGRVREWLYSDLGLFEDVESETERQKKISRLYDIIDAIDDEKDALTDVVLTESVYKLTQGNTEASAAISRALAELKNIPMPEVAEIPVTSAQIDGHMLAMLPAKAVSAQSNSLLASTEPKVEAWLQQMMFSPEQVCMQVVENSGSENEAYSDSLTLGSLGISSSEMIYLSADKASFTHFVEVLSWMKTGEYKTIVYDRDMVEVKDDVHAFSECCMAIDDLRKVLASAHALKNDDLVKQTGLESQAVYCDMSNEYHQVKGYISRLLEDMKDLRERQLGIQDPSGDDYAMAAVNDDMVAEAIRILLDCYRIGNQTALDSVNGNVFIGDRNQLDGVVEWKAIVEAQHTLFDSMQTMADNMQAKFNEAEKLIADDTERNYTTYVEAIKTVLAAGYLVVPSFRPDANVPLADLADQANGKRFVNIDDMELESMVGDLAQVEQPMMNLHQVRMFQKCNDLDIAGIVPMQIASVGDNAAVDQWLGTTVASEDDVRDAFTYIVMNPEEMQNASVEQIPVLAGLIIDHWVERIPYRNQTAAVAFGYDQPDAEAPQTLLLAMAPKDNRKGWNEDMLVNSLKSAIHMVKCRTVSPDMLCKDGWASGLFPLLEYKDIESSK